MVQFDSDPQLDMIQALTDNDPPISVSCSYCNPDRKLFPKKRAELYGKKAPLGSPRRGFLFLVIAQAGSGGKADRPFGVASM